MIVAGAAPSWSQAPSAKTAGNVSLDAGPSSTPDPLTPAEVKVSPHLAPGAAVPATEANPAAEADPIVVLVRQRLASPPARASENEKDDRAGLAAYYGASGKPVWTSHDGFTERARKVMAELGRAGDWGLKSAAFDVPVLPSGTLGVEALADAEIGLGLAFLKYGRQASGGRVNPSSVSRLFDQKPVPYEPKSLMDAVAVTDAADDYMRNLHPKHPQFERLRQAMLAARGAKADTPAPVVRIPAGPVIKPGQEHAHIALLRQRLDVSAAAQGNEQRYDEELVVAVKTFQAQAGLAASGTINKATRDALNGEERPSANGNVQRLIVNMERWRWMPENLGDFYVWDSIPDQMTSVHDKGKVVLSEKIVVGKANTPTPVFSADMQFIIFHPSWGVPPGMKANEIAPALRGAGGGWFFSSGASSVLRAHGLQVSRGGRPVDPDSINWSSVDINSFDFTQPAGPSNVLGVVKFRFPNRHDVYMHDTPERHLFNGSIRAFSHGCMRVQNPIKLAEVLLAKDKGLSTEEVQGYVRRGGEIKLTTPIPVHITYFTAHVDDAGKVHYRSDIYGLDSKTASAIEGQAVQIATGAIDRPETAESTVRPARARAPARPKAAAAKPSSNPLSALFGF